MKAVQQAALALALAFAWTPAKALAANYICRGIEGMAFYPEDRTPQWARDGVSNGSFDIAINGDRNDDVVFTSRDVSKSLVAEGAFVIQTGSLKKHGFDGLMMWYTEDGIIEHYSIFSYGERFRLAWSTFRAPIISRQTAKVGSYLADCDRK